MRSTTLTMLFVLLAGLVIGGFLGDWLSTYPSFAFLNYGKTFGLTSPFILDMNVIQLTFGFTARLNLAGIIGVVIAFILYRRF